MGTRLNFGVSVLTVGAIGAAALFGAGVGQPVHAQSSKPNIIFIILDDVGIDLLGTFGNGGAVPPATPNIDRIATNGVKFTNAWTMPECSPSRATFFTGRYALRTGVEGSLLDNHLPQSYVSSFETTLPRILTKAGYTNALIGKYHLGNLDPAGSCAPATRGFQFFQGVMRGGPPPVDTTAGGVDPSGSQVCGFFQTQAAGACYTAPGDAVRCAIIQRGPGYRSGAHLPAAWRHLRSEQGLPRQRTEIFRFQHPQRLLRMESHDRVRGARSALCRRQRHVSREN